MGDYLRWWLEEVLPGTVKDSTAEGYAYILRRYALPHFDRVPLSKLTPQHVHSMLRDMESRGLSASTRRQTRAILRRALGHAERWGLVARNVAAVVEVPRGDRTKLSDALGVSEARSLMAAAQPTRLGPLVAVVLGTGLRRGEALALRWEDVDLDAATLTVRASLKRRPGLGLVRDTPKTERGRRIIPIPGFCTAALRDQRRRQAAERLAAGAMWNDTGYVFATPIGTPIDPDNLTKQFHTLCEEAGLGRRRFHALRHSAATLMLAAGAPLEVISKTLGHAGYAITADIYAQVVPDLQRQAAEALDRSLSALS